MLIKLLAGGLLTAIAISTSGVTAHAQAIAPFTPIRTQIRTQSAPLVTQPASSRLSDRSSRSRTPYTADQLNGILGILQANPKAVTPAPTNSIESLMQRFSNATPKQTTVDPIDFFKPPALSDSFKIPLQQ